MLLKLKIAATKQHAPINQVWSTIAAFIRARRQRTRDRHILSHMNDHILRDIGFSRSPSRQYIPSQSVMTPLCCGGPNNTVPSI